MNPADSRSSANCAITGLSSFGSVCGNPLPRWVDMRAPAATARATAAARASEWPIAATMPRCTAQTISASAPGRSTASVSSRTGTLQTARHPLGQRRVGVDHRIAADGSRRSPAPG